MASEIPGTLPELTYVGGTAAMTTAPGAETQPEPTYDQRPSPSDWWEDALIRDEAARA